MGNNNFINVHKIAQYGDFRAELFDQSKNMNDSMWHRHRKLTRKLLESSSFENNSAILIMKKTRSLTKVLTTKSQHDLQDLLLRCSLDTIGLIGFGENISSLSGSQSDLEKVWDDLREITFERIKNPWNP